MKKFTKLLGWLAIILIIAYLGVKELLPRSYTLVEPGYRGVRTTWGKIDSISYPPGLVWKIPFSEEMGNNIKLIDVKPQRFQYNFSVNTKDLQKISFDCSLVLKLNENNVHNLIDFYPGGVLEYERTVIKDLVNSTIRTLFGQTDIWMFVAESQDKLITDATAHIMNDGLLKQNLMSVSSVRNLGYKASPEFEAQIEQTVQAKQGITLEEYKAQMAKKATERVKEEAIQAYERLAATAKANGLQIQIESEAVKNNPFIAQYEIAKALNKWNGTIPNLPEVFTTMKDGSNSGSDLIKFFPIPTAPNSKSSTK